MLQFCTELDEILSIVVDRLTANSVQWQTCNDRMLFMHVDLTCCYKYLLETTTIAPKSRYGAIMSLCRGLLNSIA
ncbi:Uncharacterised protein [Yersinia intermedia]|nr:Uncharacterised protein [Yersinia intermedia]